ncbi:MAG: hypothetical protein ABIF19_19150 [Planctomycetota bacterium]
MATIRVDNKCRRIRAFLYTAVSKRLGPEAGWLQNHIAACPRCRRRLVSRGKVDLALSFIKAQPHSLDLLMRANEQAISVLKHSLRHEPKAEKLKAKLPEPKLAEKYGRYGHSAANFAACIAIMFLMKAGLFSSMGQFESKGQKVIRQYYARQAGQDLADDVFTGDRA